VDVVAHLFALVAEYAVLAALQVALHQVAEEAVELDAAVVGAREAAAAQAAGGHLEIAAVLLHHHVAGDFRGAEERVLRLVDGEGLRDAVFVGRIGVVPAGFELLERDGIWGVAIDLVGAHVHEGRLGAGLAGGLQQVERADGVGVEIVEGDRGGAVVGGLRGGVHDGGGFHLLEQREHAGTVADVELVVDESRQLAHEAVLVPPGVALRAEEDGALVVIHAVDRVAEFACEIAADLGADEAGRPGDEQRFGHKCARALENPPQMQARRGRIAGPMCGAVASEICQWAIFHPNTVSGRPAQFEYHKVMIYSITTYEHP